MSILKKIFKEEELIKNRLVKILYSHDKEEIIKAVNQLIQGEKKEEVERDLLKILENWRSDESYAPFWSMIVLGYWHSLKAIPFLLDVFDSDADIWKEAAMEALERLAEKDGELILDQVEEFIEKRLDHDPFDARLFAYSPIAVLIQNEWAKRFLIRMFEADDTWDGLIAQDLVKFKDKRVLQLFRRAIERARRFNDSYREKDLRDAYCLLAGAYKQDSHELRNEPWEERWAAKLNELGKSEEEIDKMNEEIFSEKREIDIDARFKKDEKLKKIEDNIKICKSYTLADFNLEEYLKIRERGWIEQDFQLTLCLVSLSDLYNIEEIQKVMNDSSKLSDALAEVLGDYEFQTDDEMKIFLDKFQELWNNTPREEFQGLTPIEKLEVDNIKKVGRNDPCPCGSGKKFKKCCGK